MAIIRFLMKLMRFLKNLGREFFTGFASLLPNDMISNTLRRLILNASGAQIAKSAVVYRNVLILGNVTIGTGLRSPTIRRLTARLQEFTLVKML